MNGATGSTPPSDCLRSDGDAELLVAGHAESRAYSAKLLRWPDGVTIPSRFRDRISFDASHKRLIFRGLMYKADYDALRSLSSDIAFLQALEELFCKSAYGSVEIDIGVVQVFDGASSSGSSGSLGRRAAVWLTRLAAISAAGLGVAALIHWYWHRTH